MVDWFGHKWKIYKNESYSQVIDLKQKPFS